MSAEHLDRLVAGLQAAYQGGPAVNDHRQHPLPDRGHAARISHLLMEVLFPGYFSDDAVTSNDLDAYLLAHLAELQASLVDAVGRSLQVAVRRSGGGLPADHDQAVRAIVTAALSALVEVRALVSSDVEAAFQNDPAAGDRETIVLSYPCIEAIAVQRFAHRLYRLNVPILPRMMTEVAHSRTGIDIHPGAAIGESFFIDHGTGVVIGETCTIGRNCVLYHGVTLGAWNPLARDDQGELPRGNANKRHPDLEDHVTVYPGATILGGTTRIGHHSVIGGNVWLTQSVAAHSVVTMKDPELQIRQRR